MNANHLPPLIAKPLNSNLISHTISLTRGTLASPRIRREANQHDP